MQKTAIFTFISQQQKRKVRYWLIINNFHFFYKKQKACYSVITSYLDFYRFYRMLLSINYQPIALFLTRYSTLILTAAPPPLASLICKIVPGVTLTFSIL